MLFLICSINLEISIKFHESFYVKNMRKSQIEILFTLLLAFLVHFRYLFHYSLVIIFVIAPLTVIVGKKINQILNLKNRQLNKTIKKLNFSSIVTFNVVRFNNSIGIHANLYN